MNIISHRGYWNIAAEKNTLAAFERSFKIGFGIETDIRDYDGQLVISHDIARIGCPALVTVLELHKRINPALPLALNIKSDGLNIDLLNLLTSYHIENSFVFDMSIPDTLGYMSNAMRYFVRQSEYEPVPALYGQASGVWMDSFLEDWITERHIEVHLDAGKQVCLVSPELHKREHGPFWERLSRMSCIVSENLMLCTDFPEKARAHFHGKD